MESRPLHIKPEDLPPLDSNHVDLNPLIETIQNDDYSVLAAWQELGYQLFWLDHATRKTLMEELGERGDFKSIDKLCKYEMSKGRFCPYPSDAARGAAATNQPLHAILNMKPFRVWGNNDGLSEAMRGAARGGHLALLAVLKKMGLEQAQDIIGCYADIILGAAEAGDEMLAREYVRNCSYWSQYATRNFLRGAVLGGHVALVEKILSEHHCGMTRVTDSYGISTAYADAIDAAAERGDVGLVTKIFVIHASHRDAEENQIDLVKRGFVTAAKFGRLPLVLELLARAELLGLYDQHPERNEFLNAAFSVSLKARRFNMTKLLFKLGAILPDDFHYGDMCLLNEVFIARMFRAFADPVLSYKFACMIGYFKNDMPATLHVLRRVYNEFNGLDDEGIHTYFKNKELVTWLLSREVISSIYHIPKNIYLLIGTYLTLPPHVDSKTRPSNYSAVEHIQSAIQHKKSLPLIQRQPVMPTIDPAIVELKEKMLHSLRDYLRGKLLYHQREALDLIAVIEKSWCIESIYILLQEQRVLLNGKPNKHAAVNGDIFHRLAAQPKLTGHSIFHRVSLQPDFIDTLEACLDHISNYSHVPTIRSMLVEQQLYQSVPSNIRQ